MFHTLTKKPIHSIASITSEVSSSYVYRPSGRYVKFFNAAVNAGLLQCDHSVLEDYRNKIIDVVNQDGSIDCMIQSAVLGLGSEAEPSDVRLKEFDAKTAEVDRLSEIVTRYAKNTFTF